MKKLMFLLLFISLVAACGKKHKINVMGRVYNPVTNEGIPNAQIKFLVGDDITQIPGGMKKIGETTTDANGYFHAEAKNRSDIFLQVEIPDNLYRLGWYNDGIYRGPSLIKAEKNATMQPEYRAVPYGKYRIIVNNINCQGPADVIVITRQNQVGSFLGNPWTLTGCDGYATSWNDVPMGNIYTNWKVTRNGVTTEFNDTVFLNAGQELEYILNY